MEEQATARVGAKVLELAASNLVQEIEIPLPVVAVIVALAAYGAVQLGFQAYRGIKYLTVREEVQ